MEKKELIFYGLSVKMNLKVKINVLVKYNNLRLLFKCII